MYFVFVSVASAAIKMDVFGVAVGVNIVTVCRFSRKYVYFFYLKFKQNIELFVKILLLLVLLFSKFSKIFYSFKF